MKRIIGTACILTLIISAGLLPARGQQDGLTIYSGRSESLVEPLVESFREHTGIPVQVRYGGTSELAVLITEEGERSPADIFWAQDAGGLGAVSRAGLLRELPESLWPEVPGLFRSDSAFWIATSGRARLYAYSPQRTTDEQLPESVFDFTHPRYRSRVGWAPTNGSFQAFVTGLRLAHGDEAALAWLEEMAAQDVQAYRNNTSLIEAVAAGEIDFALVNNYYLGRFTSVDPDFPVAQEFFTPGDIGNMVNTAGAGILTSSSSYQQALEFIRFLLSPEAQKFIVDELGEFPVVSLDNEGSYEELIHRSPDIDLDGLADLEGTLVIMRQAGLL